MAQDEERVAILEEVITNLPDGDAELPPDRANLLHLIDRLFSESYGGDGPSSSLTTTPPWLPPLFRRYCDALVAANRLDFGSLLHFANRLLREKPAVARVVRLGWTHICVDEFQDTNRAQHDLLRLIAPGRRHNLFVVADDDQIIYQWNGASPRRFDDLRNDYELETVQLPESYRCPPEIVEHATRLIGHNTRLVTTRKTVSVREAVVPYVETVRQDSPVPGVLVEALRLANARHDRVVLRRMCRQWERLTGVAIEPHAVGAAAALAGGDFLRAWADAAADAGPGEGRTALQKIRNGLVDGLAFPGIVDSFLDDGWRSWGDGGGDESSEVEVETWRTLHRDIVGEHGRGVTLNTYLQRLDLSSKTPPPAPNAVPCITVHRSKGLQFKHVYLIGMAQEVSHPTGRSMEGSGARKCRRSAEAAS